MEVLKALKQLRDERDRLDRLIKKLEAVELAETRAGRLARKAAPTPEQRLKAAERMRQYWARRKGQIAQAEPPNV